MYKQLVNTAKEILDPPQMKRLDNTQIRNSQNGYVWQVSDFTRFLRFLVLGTEGGTYYISEKTLTKDSVNLILKLINDGKGLKLVQTIKEYSYEGRVHKQDPLLFALAACCRCNDSRVKEEAYSIVNTVCRIPTQLFSWIGYCEILSDCGTGWGRAHRRAVNSWYNSKDVQRLAFLVTKYQNRNGWTHKDVLRLGHVKPKTEINNVINKYIIKNELPLKNKFENEEKEVLNFLKVLETVKINPVEDDVLYLIRKYKLAREHIPTHWLNSVRVWSYLLENMGMTAIIRNLGKMTSIGLLTPEAEETEKINKKLTDIEYLQKARVHPLSILLALKTYEKGSGFKGKLNWTPVQSIEKALDRAFYLSFKTVSPTGDRFMLGIDVSGSMTSGISGTNISCRDASVALAMVTAEVEPECHIMGFSDSFMKLDVSPNKSLNDNIKAVSGLPFASTDCALPMIYAKKYKIPVDTFIIYTDSETYIGNTHPYNALIHYRKAMNIPKAKLIVVAMQSNGFTIAKPGDPGMLDIPGFDSSIPLAINSFINES